MGRKLPLGIVVSAVFILLVLVGAVVIYKANISSRESITAQAVSEILSNRSAVSYTGFVSAEFCTDKDNDGYLDANCDRNSLFCNITERRIQTQDSHKGQLDLYENAIVWEDWRYGIPSVFMYDLGKGNEEMLSEDREYAAAPRIYGRYIVWKKNENGKSGIAVYDINSKAKYYIISETINYHNPSLFESLIIFEGENATTGKSGLFLHNITSRQTEEIEFTLERYNKHNPEIYKDIISWEEFSKFTKDKDIKVYNLSSSRLSRINKMSGEGDQADVSIYGGAAVWQSNETGRQAVFYSRPDGTTIKIAGREADLKNPKIYNALVVYEAEGSDGKSRIYLYNADTRKRYKIGSSYRQYSPDIYGEVIVWFDKNNGTAEIYYYKQKSPLCMKEANDCDDNNQFANPATEEDCINGIDDDCDGFVDGEDLRCIEFGEKNLGTVKAGFGARLLNRIRGLFKR